MTIIYILLVSCSNNKTNDVRLRILANSNCEADQLIKNNVRDYLKEYLRNKDLNIMSLIKDCAINKSISLSYTFYI